MAQDPNDKSLDSLTNKEKEELDQSLGSGLAPEELSKEEQKELEEMALEGDKPKQSKKKDSFPKKAEVKPVKKKETRSDIEEKKQAKSGRHPSISKSDKKPKKWQPRPVELSSESDDENDFIDKPAKDKGESIFSYLGLVAATLLAVVIIFFGLAFVDAKGYLNLGVNRICVDFGLENGCLPFVKSNLSPIDDLIEVRQAFQTTSSHRFESEFSILIGSLAEETIESNDPNFQFSGTAKGNVNSQGVDILVALDEPEESDTSVYAQFAQNLITLSYQNNRLILQSDGLGYQDGVVEILEKDFLNSFEFLATTSGGITNISQENQGELSKYEIILDPSNISQDILGPSSKLELTVYVNNSTNLPEEVGLESEFAQGEISYKKRYLDYNEVEELEYDLSADRQISSSSLFDLLISMNRPKTQRDKQRKEDLTQIQSALEAYYKDKGQYPSADEIEKITDDNSAVANLLTPEYISQIPKDPLFDRHFYGYQTVEEGYRLSAVIEDEKDQDATERVNGFSLYFLTSTQ